MLDIARRGLLPLALVVLSSGVAAAQSLGGSARQMAPGSWKLVGFYQGTHDQDLTFALNSGGPCAGGVALGAFACGSGGKVTGVGNGGAVVGKAVFQPWEAMQYYLAMGAGRYNLRVPGAAGVVNVLTGDRPGFLYQAGAKAVLVPDTVAGPAIAIDGSLGLQRYFFNEVRPAATAAAGQIDQKLDLWQYQVALQASHRFDFEGTPVSVEPYGGVKWLRTHAYLKDLQGGGRIGGIQDTISPFVGLTVPFFGHEALVAEASFVDGLQYAVGMQVAFGGKG